MYILTLIQICWNLISVVYIVITLLVHVLINTCTNN